MASMNVRSGDTVEIITGKDCGKQGKVIVTNPEKGTVIVEGLNMVTKHKKPRSAQEQGGKVERERAIDVSNVALVCPVCKKTTRVNHVLGENGKYVRTCHKCGAVIDAKAEKKAAKKASTRKSKKAE
ncbi:MAG: 50S ribosomal protein L24 [Clostridia bacterium]|nr:50S ribosomal protein L24 [Clostridia bacterium]MBQ2914027.1 50S ribosomal protein L24 [Clostridia bacterium]MBQ4272734.1 50S ribosomal protein L24 [Clostridia bacterium]MBR1955032.1 50S ribosomal protein L24 [Clostridia bacterium]MBR2985836.1 50S ribosomal protein L24 [Clostridia bacterium]